MNRLIFGALAVALLCAHAPAAFAETRAGRVARLQNAVLAPCCYSGPVATHQSEIAVKMRLEIERWVGEGRTDEDILGAYTRLYGAKVLVDPNTRPQPWSIFAPWAAVAMAAIGVAALVWRWRRTALAHAPADTTPDADLPDLPDDLER